MRSQQAGGSVPCERSIDPQPAAPHILRNRCFGSRSIAPHLAEVKPFVNSYGGGDSGGALVGESGGGSKTWTNNGGTGDGRGGTGDGRGGTGDRGGGGRSAGNARVGGPDGSDVVIIAGLSSGGAGVAGATGASEGCGHE